MFITVPKKKRKVTVSKKREKVKSKETVEEGDSNTDSDLESNMRVNTCTVYIERINNKVKTGQITVAGQIAIWQGR